MYVYAKRDFTRGRDLGWLDLRATLGPDVELDFWWGFAYCERSGDRILQETLGEFMYIYLIGDNLGWMKVRAKHRLKESFRG